MVVRFYDPTDPSREVQPSDQREVSWWLALSAEQHQEAVAATSGDAKFLCPRCPADDRLVFKQKVCSGRLGSCVARHGMAESA